jgi:hypothetical protein
MAIKKYGKEVVDWTTPFKQTGRVRIYLIKDLEKRTKSTISSSHGNRDNIKFP